MIIELDHTNSAQVFMGHIWFGWPFKYPKNGQKWPKKVKNDLFQHTHMVTQKILLENVFLDTLDYISSFQNKFCKIGRLPGHFH